MKVLHAIWLPESTSDFVQTGSFHLWAETMEPCSKTPDKGVPAHPFQVDANAWPGMLESLGWKPSRPQSRDTLQRVTLQLPSSTDVPLPSPELAKVWPEDIDTSATELRPWQVDTQRLDQPIKQLSDVHFLAIYQAEDIQPGGDFLFWYWFTQELKRLLLRDQYLPALVYRSTPKTKGKKHTSAHQLIGAWQWASEQYEQLIIRAGQRMPPACAAGSGSLAQADSLLRHCAEVLLNLTVRETPVPATFQKKIAQTILAACLGIDTRSAAWPIAGDILETYRHWKGCGIQFGVSTRGATTR